MATKNSAAKAAPKTEKAAKPAEEKLTAGQKAAATKKANAAKVAPAKSAKVTKTGKSFPAMDKEAKEAAPKATAKAAPVKLVKPKAKAETVDVKAKAPPKAAKAAPAKATPAETDEVVTSIGRKQLAETLRERMSAAGIAVPLKVTETLVAEFENTVSEALAQGSEVALPGFGKFRVSLRKGGQRRSPATGEAVTVADAWAVGFKVGKALKDKVNTRPTA